MRLADREGDREVGAGSLDCLAVTADTQKGSLASVNPSSRADRVAANDEFVEAVAIAHLTRLLADPVHPLGRLRRTKLLYLAHRKADEDVRGRYLKKAAGPYNPWARYQGPERIAQRNGYVKSVKAGKLVGFVTASKIEKIDKYAPGYSVCTAVEWVAEKFRYRTKDELELLTTVDFAALELVQSGIPIDLGHIKTVIADNEEWKAKLDRAVFSDDKITEALIELRQLFPDTYKHH